MVNRFDREEYLAYLTLLTETNELVWRIDKAGDGYVEYSTTMQFRNEGTITITFIEDIHGYRIEVVLDRSLNQCTFATGSVKRLAELCRAIEKQACDRVYVFTEHLVEDACVYLKAHDVELPLMP